MSIFSKKQPLSILVLAISLICHIAAHFQFQMQFETFSLFDYFSYQFYIFLVLSLFLSFLLFFLTNHIAFFITLIVKFLLIPVIGNPLGSYLGIEAVLTAPLIFEVCIYEPFPSDAILSGCFVFIIAGIKYFGAEYRGELFHGLLLFLLFSIMFVVTNTLLKHYREKLVVKEKAIKRLDSTVVNLADANIGFQRYANVAERKSSVEERNRITRELHDSVGYSLTNLITMMDASVILLKDNPEKLRELLTDARIHAEGALEEMRKILYLLRQVEEPAVTGLRAIQGLVDVFSKATQIEVIVNYGNLPWSFGERIDPVIYRLVQEGMTNAFRHGNAAQIRINFWQTDEEIKASIWDNGSGAAEIKEGMGMIGMKERIGALGGGVLARNVVDGFNLSAWIPFKAKISYE